ncbi:MAG: hypothetical protein O2880_03555 [Proteobacteria bacterium]|nr:hypothetical protein [Pseudomonadota bacterium]
MPCILSVPTTGGRENMTQQKLRRVLKGREIVQADGMAKDVDPEEAELLKASANAYDRRMKSRVTEHHGDWWIAVALYMILAGIAFAIF